MTIKSTAEIMRELGKLNDQYPLHIPHAKPEAAFMSEVFSRYPELEANDSVHDWKHSCEVYHTWCCFSDTVAITRMAIAYAVAHDAFSSKDRANHHTLAAESIDERLSDLFADDELILLTRACQYSRTEYSAGHQAAAYGQLECELKAADTCLPKATKAALMDSPMRYAIEVGGHTPFDAVNVAVKHLVDKYGRGGTLHRPGIWVEEFGDTLEHTYDLIDELNSEYLLQTPHDNDVTLDVNLVRNMATWGYVTVGTIATLLFVVNHWLDSIDASSWLY